MAANHATCSDTHMVYPPCSMRTDTLPLAQHLPHLAQLGAHLDSEIDGLIACIVLRRETAANWSRTVHIRSNARFRGTEAKMNCLIRMLACLYNEVDRARWGRLVIGHRLGIIVGHAKIARRSGILGKSSVCRSVLRLKRNPTPGVFTQSQVWEGDLIPLQPPNRSMLRCQCSQVT